SPSSTTASAAPCSACRRCARARPPPCAWAPCVTAAPTSRWQSTTEPSTAPTPGASWRPSSAAWKSDGRRGHVGAFPQPYLIIRSPVSRLALAALVLLVFACTAQAAPAAVVSPSSEAMVAPEPTPTPVTLGPPQYRGLW